MSTQRRVAPRQRFNSTKQTGTAVPASIDDGLSGPQKQFRRVAQGLTASSLHFEETELATNSLGSRCKWRFRHGTTGFDGSHWQCSTLFGWNGTSGSSPAFREFPAGHLPRQLPILSPLLSGTAELERRSASCSARFMRSALPQVLTGICPRTERHHGQGNLYLQHAARNAACDSGRRSARRDLLRA
jgi:hypothetical protein